MSDAPERIWAQCTAHENWDEPVATQTRVDHFHCYMHEDLHFAEIARLTARVAELDRALDDACFAMSDLCSAPIGIIPKSSDRFYDYRSGLFRAPLTSKETQNND